MEAKIITHENNEMAWAEKYEQQEYKLKLSEWKLGCKVSELEKVTKERDKYVNKFAAWKEASLSHESYVAKTRRSHIRAGIGYCDETNSSEEVSTSDKESSSSEEYSTCDDDLTNSEENTSSSEEQLSETPPEFKKDKEYHVVPPPPGMFQPPRKDVSSFGVDNLEFRKKLTGQSDSSPSSSKSVREAVEKPS